MYDSLHLTGTRLDVVLSTAHGLRKLISTQNISINVGVFDCKAQFTINDVLVIEELPDLENNYPNNQGCQKSSRPSRLSQLGVSSRLGELKSTKSTYYNITKNMLNICFYVFIIVKKYVEN